MLFNKVTTSELVILSELSKKVSGTNNFASNQEQELALFKQEPLHNKHAQIERHLKDLIEN